MVAVRVCALELLRRRSRSEFLHAAWKWSCSRAAAVALKSRMSSFVRLAPDGAPVALTTPDPAFVALDEAAAVRKKFSTGRCEALVRASAAAFLAAVVSARRALMYAAMLFAGLSLPEPRR